jgi:hypothetical protein
MKDRTHMDELLRFLYSEREKIESTGCRMDPDLKKTHCFINEEIQNLQMMLFEREYHQFSERLEQLFVSSPGFIEEKNGNAF